MSELSGEEALVGRHYDETIFAFEAERLVRHCPVEYAITSRYLRRYIPSQAIVTEAGVGVGHYSELLARHGCRLYLVDVAERLLRAARQRLQAAGLAARILGTYRASATRLDGLGSGSCDAVLLLGPLYHLRAAEDRRRAVHEAVRILRPGGLVFAAAINRLAYLRDTFRDQPEEGAMRRAFHARFVQDGNLDPAHAPPIGFAHLSTVAEVRALFAPVFEELALVGVEAFTGVWQDKLHGLSPESTAAWLDLVEQLGATPEGLGASDHFLYIGRRGG
jgi:SAM-dependent methyltransferase